PGLAEPSAPCQNHIAATGSQHGELIFSARERKLRPRALCKLRCHTREADRLRRQPQETRTPMGIAAQLACEEASVEDVALSRRAPAVAATSANRRRWPSVRLAQQATTILDKATPCSCILRRPRRRFAATPSLSCEEVA